MSFVTSENITKLQFDYCALRVVPAFLIPELSIPRAIEENRLEFLLASLSFDVSLPIYQNVVSHFSISFFFSKKIFSPLFFPRIKRIRNFMYSLIGYIGGLYR